MAEESKRPYSGPADDTDPATQQYREKNWEKDERRAEVMAHAEDEEQSDIVKIKRHVFVADSLKKGTELLGVKATPYQQEYHDSMLGMADKDIKELGDQAQQKREEAGRQYDTERQAAERVIDEKKGTHPDANIQEEIEMESWGHQTHL